MAIVDILFDLAPEFYTTDLTALGRIGRIIGYAAEDVSRSPFGVKADRGTALLAAHMLTIARIGGTGSGSGATPGGGGPVAVGPIISEKVGDVERKYAGPSSSGSGSGGSSGMGSDLGYGATTYGQEFMRLLRTLAISTPLVID